MSIEALDAALAERLLPIVRIAGEEQHGRIEDRLAHYGCPAVAVAVLQDGAPVWSAGYGRRERGGAEAATADTVFAGASISKPLTAALVMQRVEQGRLDLDTDVNRYLSAWQVPDNEFTRAQPVTLRHLMSHRAGTTVHGFGGQPPGRAKPSVLDTLLGRPPASTPPVTVDKRPGGSIRYSGGGYTVLQLVLEEQSGRGQTRPKAPPKTDTRQLPVQIVACAHCGLNLPQTDALQDVAGRPFCSEAHRVAGPR